MTTFLVYPLPYIDLDDRLNHHQTLAHHPLFPHHLNSSPKFGQSFSGKISWDIFKQKCIPRNLYLPLCVLNVIRLLIPKQIKNSNNPVWGLGLENCVPSLSLGVMSSTVGTGWCSILMN